MRTISEPQIAFQNIPTNNDIYYAVITMLCAENIVFIEEALITHFYGHSAAAANRYRLMKDKYWSERTDKIIFQIKYMQKAQGRKLIRYEKLKEEAYKYFKKENVVEFVSEEDFIKGFL